MLASAPVAVRSSPIMETLKTAIATSYITVCVSHMTDQRNRKMIEPMECDCCIARFAVACDVEDCTCHFNKLGVCVTHTPDGPEMSDLEPEQLEKNT